MKKCILVIFITITISISAFAQGFYFDIGLGLGMGWTKIDGTDFVDYLKSYGGSVDEIAIDLGLKAGYGPFGNIPIYVVGELSGMAHRIWDSSNYIQFNSYLIGPGVIFYPIPLIQISSSAGYSFVGNQTDLPVKMYDSKIGYAFNFSVAVDLGKRNHGLLIGLKYFYANNKLETSNVDQASSMIGLFIKYAYRKKAPSLF